MLPWLLLTGRSAEPMLTPEGSAGWLPCDGLLSEKFLRSGPLTVRTPRSAWPAERTPRRYWAAGYAVPAWKTHCPGCDGPGPCWESGSR